MERRKKIALVALVLGIGIALALEFRKTDAPASAPAESGSTVASGDVRAPREQNASDVRIDAARGNVTVGRSADVPAGSSIGGGSAAAIEPAATTPKPRETYIVGPLVDVNAPEQTHTIADGDTLPKIAERYLGSADRSFALYEHNRDVLRNPDVLPIGAELRIPSQVTLNSIGNANPAATTLQAISPPPTSPLTPMGSKVPTAAAAQRTSPRTYTVKAGDTLVDIARTIYGDGRRYESLFEANRRVLRTPTDLKPGTVLVVP